MALTARALRWRNRPVNAKGKCPGGNQPKGAKGQGTQRELSRLPAGSSRLAENSEPIPPCFILEPAVELTTKLPRNEGEGLRHLQSITRQVILAVIDSTSQRFDSGFVSSSLCCSSAVFRFTHLPAFIHKRSGRGMTGREMSLWRFAPHFRHRLSKQPFCRASVGSRAQPQPPRLHSAEARNAAPDWSRAPRRGFQKAI